MSQPIPRCHLPTLLKAQEIPLDKSHDFIWVDTDRFGDSSGEYLFDLNTGEWYQWNRSLGGYALPDNSLATYTLILNGEGNYGIQPAPSASFSLPSALETENSRINWGMSIGQKFVLLQEDIRERDTNNQWATAAQNLYIATNDVTAQPQLIGGFNGTIHSPSHELNQYVVWAPGENRAALEQFDGDSQTHTFYLFDAPASIWRTVDPGVEVFNILWSPDGEFLALRTSAGVAIYDWATDELRQTDLDAGIPSWAADSQKLLINDFSGLQLLDSISLEWTTFTDVSVSGLNELDNLENSAGWTWYGEGNWTLVRGTVDDGLYRLDLETGDLQTLFTPTSPWQTDFDLTLNPFEHIAVSPDESLIAFSWYDQLWLTPSDPTQGAPQLVYEGEIIFSVLWDAAGERLLFTTGENCPPNILCTYSLRLTTSTGVEPEKLGERNVNSLYGPVLRSWLP